MLPPNAKVTRVLDPALEPLSLADAKNFLRVEVADDDALIAGLISAARLECENLTDRSFIATTWRLTLDYLPLASGPYPGFPFPVGQGVGTGAGAWNRVSPNDGGIQLPMPPLISLSSLNYIDQSGATQTLDPSAVIVSAGTPGRIYPRYGTYFPFTQCRAAAVDITYTAGYGPSPADVPASVVTAIRYLTAHYYEHRTEAAEVPPVVERLLDTVRWGA